MDINIIHARFIARLHVMYAKDDRAGIVHELSVCHLSFLPSVILYCHRYAGDDAVEAIFTAAMARLSDVGESEPF